jgi:hypothetical protein
MIAPISNARTIDKTGTLAASQMRCKIPNTLLEPFSLLFSAVILFSGYWLVGEVANPVINIFIFKKCGVPEARRTF